MFSIYKKNNRAFEYKGKSYEMNLAFDNVLEVIDELSNKKRSESANILTAIFFVFGDGSELGYVNATERKKIMNQFLEFINEQPYQQKPEENETYADDLASYYQRKNELKQPSYSIEYDAQMIYAAFMQTYHIDLIEQQGKLDWFKFQALLNGLPDETKFKQIVSIRNWKKPPKKPNKEAEMRKLKAVYAIPNKEEVDDWLMEQ